MSNTAKAASAAHPMSPDSTMRSIGSSCLYPASGTKNSMSRSRAFAMRNPMIARMKSPPLSSGEDGCSRCHAPSLRAAAAAVSGAVASAASETGASGTRASATRASATGASETGASGMGTPETRASAMGGGASAQGRESTIGGPPAPSGIVPGVVWGVESGVKSGVVPGTWSPVTARPACSRPARPACHGGHRPRRREDPG